MSGNSGGGTDHGWGGISFMLGGSVQGGRILGEYPNDLTSESSLDIGEFDFWNQICFKSIVFLVAFLTLT